MSTEAKAAKKLIVVGNGMAGMHAVEELLDLAPDLYEITVFGAEPHGNYNRILLSLVLSGEKKIEDIMINDRAWYDEHGITLHTDTKIVQIERGSKRVITDDGQAFEYDRLLLATGSDPVILPLPGHDLPGVIGFRDIHDVDTMIKATKDHKHAVVIGGGLLGLEAANGLMKQGMEVTVVHLMDTLMERQLDVTAGKMLQANLESRGLKFAMSAQSETIMGEDRVTGLRLADGTEIPADILVMAVGIRPNTTLAADCRLHFERGIVVDDSMLTFDPSIYAIGECVQHRGIAYGLVAPLFEQGRVVANHLAELGFITYKGSMTSTKLKVTGIDLFSAGDFIGDDTTEDIVFNDPGNGSYKKLVLKDGVIQGAVLYGDTVDGAWYFQLMRDQTDTQDIRSHLLFGQSHLGDSGHGGENAAASLPDDAEICGCNGVCKGDVVKAITENNLFTLEEVRAHTKASSSCGSCTGLVEQIMASTLGSDFSTSEKEKPVCGCTDLTHEDVRAAIVEQDLKDIPSTMRFLNWQTSDGCPTCRPALNYYLLCAWPGEYVDDARSRFINERAHGNIQKDGTYSVVPRMWGGITTPKELRAIADVADKFKIPTVKVTGGQRIDLFGVAKTDLPAVWKDLNDAGMVSGHAYGKSLRTVKTCAGQQWCRFGTQDSIQLGIDIEKMTWGSWTPHKFKFAVSGCPRNCAEATIKDFGVVAVESGFELHIAGNGGIKVRVTDLLCKVETEAEVMEYAGAFMQIYREQARYLDRTAPWVERVGLTYVQEQIVDDADNRKALYERFLLSQSFSQIDPWKDSYSDPKKRAEFETLTTVGQS